ncbi:MAG: sulfite exporter TauE/SafE family protein [Halioglobus sp.]|nr:sulfite exporter TauE/SafE family protein [Halioglobus sp.]
MFTLEESLAALAVAVVSSLVQSSFGIGGAVIAAPLLYLVNPIFAPVPILVSNVAISALAGRREWEHVQRADLGAMLTGRLVGTFLAAWFVIEFSGAYFDIVFGLMVLGAVLLLFVGLQIAITPGTLGASGVVSGFMGTISSIGGPPIALVYRGAPVRQFRATMSMQLCIGGALSAVGFALASGVTRELVYATLLLLPGSLLGYHASGYNLARVNQRVLNLAVLLISGGAGLVVIVRALVAGA